VHVDDAPNGRITLVIYDAASAEAVVRAGVAEHIGPQFAQWQACDKDGLPIQVTCAAVAAVDCTGMSSLVQALGVVFLDRVYFRFMRHLCVCLPRTLGSCSLRRMPPRINAVLNRGCDVPALMVQGRMGDYLRHTPFVRLRAPRADTPLTLQVSCPPSVYVSL
jgi:hypothetical protein